MEKKNSSSVETAYLAGGCFWGMEELIRKIPGVLDVEVGYMGGNISHATYKVVKTGETGHAETVRIQFDSNRLSFAELLCEFFRMHDPTTSNRQGNDLGSQYRSAIFYTSEAQKVEAQKVIGAVNHSNLWGKPVVTELAPARDFWVAESEHQDYLQRIPNGYSCHFMRNFDFRPLVARVQS